MKVSSIGELKTARQDSEHIQAQVSLVAAARSSLPRLPISNSPPQADRMVLPPPMAERRKRQLTVMAKAMAAATERGKEVTKAALNDFHFRDLENVVERCGHRKFEWVKAGDGFIIGAVRLSRGRKPKLSSLLLSKATDRAAHLADDAPGWAMKILRAEQRLNSLIVGSVFGDAQSFVAPRHAFPVVLWPIAPAVLADLMFSRVMVVTMLNPGHIWASIADMGFELQTDNKGRIISAKMTEGDHIVELKNIEYYTRMIAYFMMTEPSIISLIEQLISHSKEKFAGGSMMVELDPRINRFPPLRRTSSH